MKTHWLYLVVLMLVAHSASGQFSFRNECALVNQTYNPVPIKDSNEVHSPKKATIMSAFVPGLGQIYNKKYWKVGVLYGAAFAIGYGIKVNSDSLKRYQSSLIAVLDTTSSKANYYPSLPTDKIRSERDYYRKNRDRLGLGAGLLYALQIIDANVDAHLREFDVNDDLAFKPNPGFLVANNRLMPSFGFSLRF